MKNKLGSILVGLVCLLPLYTSATVVTVNFGEVAVADQTNLSGTSIFSAQGLSFSDGTTFTSNPLFLEDGVGVYNGQTVSTIIFDNLANNLSVSYAIYSSVINVFAYSTTDVLLGSFTGGGTNGTGTINASGISYITFQDSGGNVGIDSLTWNTSVPEPLSIVLAGLGLAGIGFRKKQKI